MMRRGSRDRLRELEERLTRLEDIEQIREVLSFYGYTADLGLADAYAGLFTPDGLYDIGDSVVQGREGLHDLIEDPAGYHKVNIEGPGSQHIVVNLRIEPDGDIATAEGYSIVLVRGGPHDFQVHTAAYNHWDLVRNDGRWLLTARRRIEVGEINSPGGRWGGEVMTSFQKSDRVAAGPSTTSRR